MSPEREHELVVKFPALFAGRTYPATESLMCFGCECDDGWFHILFSMCCSIDQHIRNGGWKYDDPYRFLQIKEKFGTLRVYDYGHDDFISGAISVAEDLSGLTCEVCGSPGVRCCARGGYWLKTLCRQHAEQQEYRPVETNDLV